MYHAISNRHLDRVGRTQPHGAVRDAQAELAARRWRQWALGSATAGSARVAAADCRGVGGAAAVVGELVAAAAAAEDDRVELRCGSSRRRLVGCYERSRDGILTRDRHAIANLEVAQVDRADDRRADEVVVKIAEVMPCAAASSGNDSEPSASTNPATNSPTSRTRRDEVAALPAGKA